jgi:hypothetical protein
MTSNNNVKTVITFFFDVADSKNKGWAYHTTITTFADVYGERMPIDKEHDTGAVGVKRRDAGITTVRRAFFRDANEGSFFAGLQRAAARADWSYENGAYRAVIWSQA